MDTYSWDGRGTTHDLAALKIKGGTVTVSDGGQGPVHMAHAEINVNQPGVLLRLHGGGIAPY